MSKMIGAAALICAGVGLVVASALPSSDGGSPVRLHPGADTASPEPPDSGGPSTKADVEALVNPDKSPFTWVCGPDADGNFTVVLARPSAPDAKPDPEAGPPVELPAELKNCPMPATK